MSVLYRRDEVVIRPAREQDIEPVLALENELYSTPWSEQSFRFELYNHRSLFWIVEVSGELAGYQVGWRIHDSYHLHNLAIHPRFQGAGLAREVLEFLIVYAARMALRSIELEVRASNLRALRLYRRAGFRPVGIRPKYYRRPQEDAVLMQNLI